MRTRSFFKAWATRCFVFVSTLVMACTTFAFDAKHPLTLQEAITRTLQHNPELYQYRLSRDVLDAEKQISTQKPAVAVELVLENFAGTGEIQGFDSAELTVALSSVIELGGKRRARMASVGAKRDQADWQQQAATLDVLGALTAQYLEALATQANITLAEESLRLAQSVIRTVESRSARGASPEAEVMRARASVVRAELRLSALQEQFAREKVFLARYWGERNPAFSHLSGSLFTFNNSLSFASLYQRVQQSPAMEVFASEARLQDAQLALVRTSNRADIQWRAGIRQFNETGDTALVAEFSVPLFSKKRNSAKLTAAMAERNTVDFARKDALLNLHAKLFEAHSLHKQSIDAVTKTQQAEIPTLESALRLTQQAYDDGRYRFVELIAAQEELLAAKQALIDTALTALMSQALIEQLTGETLAH